MAGHPRRAVGRGSVLVLMVAFALVMGGPGSPAERCAAFGEAFYTQAERDFARFHGLSEWDAQRTRNVCQAQGTACFVVHIQNGQVYVSKEQAGFQSRNRITMAFLQRVADKLGPLPDAEFVVDTSDGYSEIGAPLFVIAKFPKSSGGILYPDFSSFAWPESECPSEPSGSHVWRRAAADLSSAPPWHAKADTLFWRGAPTSVYRKQLLPRIQAMPDTNVSFMEWILSAEGRQTVQSGQCVSMADWCRHRYLANLPGNTMSLSLKYRLLCGSVVVSSPLLYHEWFYSQLENSVHYVEVDLGWASAGETLSLLRANERLAEGIGMVAKEWAMRHLTDDAFDCYWRRLVELAHAHFPPPQLGADAVPLEHAMLTSPCRSCKAGNERRGPHAFAPSPAPSASSKTRKRTVVDVAIVIPARVSDVDLMNYARQTWLRHGTSTLTQRHYFVFSADDEGAADLATATRLAASAGDGRSTDVLVVDCPHGYRWLLLKMAMAYRALLDELEVAYFVRADIDSVMPLDVLLPLLPAVRRGEAVVPSRISAGRACIGAARWRSRAVGHLACQSECAANRACRFFAVNGEGDCTTFAECFRRDAHEPDTSEHDEGEVFEYALRGLLLGTPPASRSTAILAPMAHPGEAFVLGTILYGYGVLWNDTHNPQWNNKRYSQDLGLTVYPPYAEASGYAMSASVAAFLAGVGVGELASLAWKAWAIEDAAFGTALAGLNVSFLQLPVELRDRMRVIHVPRRPPSSS